MVDVAQLVRAPVCGTGGRGFKSRHPPQLSCTHPSRQYWKGFLFQIFIKNPGYRPTVKVPAVGAGGIPYARADNF